MSAIQDYVKTTNEEKLNNAIDDALEAFWQEFASHYPEAESGDLDPETVFALDEVARKSGKKWVQANT